MSGLRSPSRRGRPIPGCLPGVLFRLEGALHGHPQRVGEPILELAAQPGELVTAPGVRGLPADAEAPSLTLASQVGEAGSAEAVESIVSWSRAIAGVVAIRPAIPSALMPCMLQLLLWWVTVKCGTERWRCEGGCPYRPIAHRAVRWRRHLAWWPGYPVAASRCLAGSNGKGRSARW